MILIVFGLPGAGKTFAGTVFRDTFNFHVHDGDAELPEDMDRAIRNSQFVTEDMRDRFFKSIVHRLHLLKIKHSNIVLAQTFLKERHRKQVHDAFPEAQFVLIQTPTDIREQRLSEREEYPLDPDYARAMVCNFDTPEIPHTVIQNKNEGTEEIKKQIRGYLLQSDNR